MKSFRNYIWAVLLACVSFSARAVIDSICVYKNDTTDTELCLIGDAHDIEQDLDKKHKQVLYTFINQWATADQYTLFLLEANNYSLNDHKKDFKKMGLTPGDSYMLYDLAFLADCYKQRRYKKVQYNFSDIRGDGIYTLNQFHHFMKGLLPKLTLSLYNKSFDNIFALHAFFIQNHKLQKPFFKKNIKELTKGLSKALNSNPARKFLQEIDGKLNFINNYIKEINPTSPEAQHLSQLYKNIKASKQQAYEFFRKHLNGFGQSALTAFTNSLKNEKSFKAIIEAQQWLETFAFDIADAGFLINILKSQRDFKQIVLFAGAGHISGLQCLKNMGYRPILEKGNTICKSKDDCKEGGLATPEIIDQWLSYAFTGEKKDSQSASTSTASSSSASASSAASSSSSSAKQDTSAAQAALKICAACNKTGVSKCCARCEQVYYCSRDCQLKDWKRHKPNCKK